MTGSSVSLSKGVIHYCTVSGYRIDQELNGKIRNEMDLCDIAPFSSNRTDGTMEMETLLLYMCHGIAQLPSTCRII